MLVIRDVRIDQNFFIKSLSTYHVILGQRYIMANRMETKVMDDGSAYLNIRSQDNIIVILLLMVCANHVRNYNTLREQPIQGLSKNLKI